MVYQSVENTVEVLVAIVTIGLILVAIMVGSMDTWKELGAGLINIGYKDPGMSVKQLFIALVFRGCRGDSEPFFTLSIYATKISAWVRSCRGYRTRFAAGRRKYLQTGFIFQATAENRKRFTAWWQYVKNDQILFFWALNTLTILLFIFGALAVLHPQGIVPERGRLIYDEAQILGELWGTAGTEDFLVSRCCHTFRDAARPWLTAYHVPFLTSSIRISVARKSGILRLVVSPHRWYLDCRRMCNHFRNGTIKRQ